MKPGNPILVGLLSLLGSVMTSFTQVTAFTYQGRLTEGNVPYNGLADFAFRICDSAENPWGSAWLTKEDVPVTNGLFTVLLDFHPSWFDGNPRWLEIAVRPGNSTGDYTTLSPRQPISAAPYAVALTGPLKSAQFSGYYSSAVTLANSANRITGIFTGDGSAIDNLSPTALRTGKVLELGVARFEQIFAPGEEFIRSSHQLCTGDFNGDGWPDLALLSSSGGDPTMLTVYTNNTRNGFVQMWRVITNMGGHVPTAIVAADVNGDGYTDLYRANTGTDWAGNSVSLYRGGPATMTYVGEVTVGQGPVALMAADLNGDGRPDLVTANAGARNIQVFINTGANLPSLSATFPYPLTGHFGHGTQVYMDHGDLNRDGRRDFVVGLGGGNASFSRLCLFTNSGGSTFVLATNLSPADLGEFWMQYTGLRCVDLDGDGAVEIVYTSTEAAGLSAGVLKCIPYNLSCTMWRRIGGKPANSLAVVDLNFDGIPDVVTGKEVWINNGRGGFGLETELPAAYFGGDIVVSADFDRDGRADLFAASYSWAGKQLFRNTAGVTTRGSFEVRNNAGTSRFLVDDQGLRLLATNGATLFSVSETNGAISGNGSGLTQLNASQITSGTLADSRLSPNLALRTGGNSFTGTQIITGGNVGINTPAPQAPLHVWGRAIVNGTNQWDVNNTEGDLRIGSDSYRLKIGVAQSGGGAGDVWIRAHGGTARVFLKAPGGTTLYSNEDQTTGVSLAAGGGSWTTLSDRNAKDDFQPVNPLEVLEKVAALPLSTWRYKSQDASIRHIGPTAQDFKAAFGVGETDTGIATVDADGVALAAIQGLNRKVESARRQTESRLQELEAENHALRQRLERLERLLSQQKQNQDNQ
jgi:hypothetical protein